MMGHASFRALTRYADSTASRSERAALAEHLARCRRCRAELESIRELGDAARELAQPSLPAGGFDRIHRRIRAGERVILPATEGRGKASRRPWRRVAAATAAVAVLAVGALVRPGPVLAGRSELVLRPARPMAGELVEVEYQPGGLFSGEDRLVLRARFRRPGSEPYSVRGLQAVADTLVAGRGGTFTGRFRFPEAVAYAAVAVEDLAGERIDNNQGRLWELLAHDGSGRPTLRALLERVTDSLGRSWDAGHGAAQKATRIYPDSAAAWVSVGIFQRQLVPASARDSLEREQTAVFDRLHEHYVGQPAVDPEVAADLWYLAWGLSGGRISSGARGSENPDSVGTRMALWKDRVLESDGYGPRATLVRNTYAMVNQYREPPAHLRELEQVWARLHDRSGYAARLVLRDAVDMGVARKVGAEAHYEWLQRRLAFSPAVDAYVGKQLASMPGHEREGIELLAQAARRRTNPDDASRALSMPRSEFARQGERNRARVLVDLARVFLDTAGPGQARAAIEEAAEGPWNPSLLPRIADAFLELGDTTRAVDAFASLAADPVAPPAYEDSVRARVGDLQSYDWSDRVRQARAEVDAAIRDQLEDRVYATRHVTIAGVDGQRKDLRVGTGRVSVVSLWSPSCGWSLQELSELVAFQRKLRSRGLDHFAVKGGPPSPADPATLAEWDAAALDVTYDIEGEVSRGFGVFGTPAHVVLDGEGRIRYVIEGSGTFDRVIRAATVLQ